MRRVTNVASADRLLKEQLSKSSLPCVTRPETRLRDVPLPSSEAVGRRPRRGAASNRRSACGASLGANAHPILRAIVSWMEKGADVGVSGPIRFSRERDQREEPEDSAT